MGIVLRRADAMTVYRSWQGMALGDTICIAGWLLRKSEKSGHPARLANHFPTNRDYGIDKFREMLPMCASMLDSPGSIELVDWSGPMVNIEGHWTAPRHRMRDPALRWNGGRDGTIAVQWNGHSGGNQKNPPPADLARLMSFPNVVPIGLPMTILESARVLAGCKFFAGSCSGLSHVAHAVKCPMIVLEMHQAVTPWHPPEDELFQIAHGVNDCMDKMAKLLEVMA